MSEARVARRTDYNPAAAPGTYDHAGRYCELCQEQTSYFRDYRASGPMYCTLCGVIEGTTVEERESLIHHALLSASTELANLQRNWLNGTVEAETLRAQAQKLLLEVEFVKLVLQGFPNPSHNLSGSTRVELLRDAQKQIADALDHIDRSCGEVYSRDLVQSR